MRRLVVVGLGVVLFTSGLGPVPFVFGAERRWPRTVARDVVVQRAGVREASRDVTLPIRANMVTVSWLGSAGTVELRTRTPAGRWSSWAPVEPSDIGPDAGETINDRQVTEPVWVGEADAVKVRVRGGRGDVRDVKLHLINTMGNAQPRTILARVGGFFASLFRSPPRAKRAEAIPAFPSIVSRSGWGADESWRRHPPRYAPVLEMAFVHHTATTNSYSSSQVPGIIRGIYHSHVYGRGYDDIAYNFLIDRYGRIFEGRAGGVGNTVIGGHTAGMNSRTTGVALIGTFDSPSPPAAMVSALERVLAWKLDVHHVPATGQVLMTSGGSDKFAPGTQVWMNRISGHRNAQATGCPGNRVYNQLTTIRSRVSALGRPKIYVIERPGLVLRPDGDGSSDTFRVKATLSPKLSWRLTFSDVSGTVKRVHTGTSYDVSVSWNGTDATGAFGKTGIGSWKLEATDPSSGAAARAATGQVYLVTDHPDGTLLQSGSTRAFLEGRATRAITDDLVAQSWFRPGEAITTGTQEITRYSIGTPLRVRDGTILKSSDGAYHLVVGGVRRTFESPEVFADLGYTNASAIAVSDAALASIPSGPDITDASVHPEGAVVSDSSGIAWVISGGQRHSLRTTSIRRSWYRDAEVVRATTADLALTQGSPLTFRPGSLFRSADGRYWIASAGMRRQFADGTIMAAMGYRETMFVRVANAEAGTMPPGPRIG